MLIPIIEENINKGYTISGQIEVAEPKKDFIIELPELSNPSPKITDREWLEMFPEARPYLKRKLSQLKKLHKEKSDEILKDFARLYKHDYKDDISRWFGEEMIKVWKGDEVDKLAKEIKNLSFMLNPPKEIKGHITPEMIERVKRVPFDTLGLKFSRADKTICPFHSEKTPSLHWNKQKNYIYCFGCNYKADVIKFIMDFYKLSFQDAVQKLI